MYTYTYCIMFLLSMVCLLFISTLDFKKIPYAQWTLIILVEFINFGYSAVSMSQTLETALLANTIVYLGETILPTVFLISLMGMLKYKINNFLRSGLYIFSVSQLISVFFGSSNGVFMKSPEINITKCGTLLTWQAGPLSILNDIYVIGIMITVAILFIKAYREKNSFQRMFIQSYLVISIIMIIVYTVHLIFKPSFQILSPAYFVCICIMAFSYNMNFIYDIESIVEHKNQKNEIKNGYVMFDLHKRYICATPKALELVPDISEFTAKTIIDADKNEISRLFCEQMEKLEVGKNDEKHIKRGDITCKYTVSYFSLNRHGGTSGYIFELSDDTERQKHIEFMENYNNVLKEDVKKHTEHISKIQERVVLGLANMIENRDNNTGGHVKRTSDIVQILVNSMLKNNTHNIERTFAEDVIRAAPMHDLGKIAVDNSILCKPGKLTNEEYEIMKSHAPKSGEIVLNILEGVEKQHFVNTAFNVARYHHERWDGNGYPDGLEGKNIPLEARIMAIADVYDALVSKRCYKEPMSYEKAYEIMMENMGTQFDPSLAPTFSICREKLEQYYSEIQ